jgi:hypothetical protein
MSLQQLVLDDALIASLYGNISLLSDSQTSKENAKNTHTPPVLSSNEYKFLGGNQQGIGLIVKYDKDVFLPDEQLAFLVTILQACKLTLQDVAIFNYASVPFTYASLRETFTFKQFLVFGIEPVLLLLPEMAYFSPYTHNEVQILYVPELEKLNTPSETGKLLKSRLWLCLKQLFI